jgi:hypothetical protein
MEEAELRRLLMLRDDLERETARLVVRLTQMTEDRDRWVAAYRVAASLADSEQRERMRAEAERDVWATRARNAEAALGK